MTRTGDKSAPRVRVSALVSIYRAEKYLRGCLQALVSQTLFRRGEMEILCRDAGSPENEAAIVDEYARVHPRIRYSREESRLPLYECWNRAANEAAGEYLLAASADDRLVPTAAELLAQALDERNDCDVAYGDWVEVPADRLDEPAEAGRVCRAGTFSHLRLLRHFFLGSQPMWRRSAHHRHKGFDTSLKIAADYDFVLKLTSGGRRACRVDGVLGRVGRHADALSASAELAREDAEISDRWLRPDEIQRRANHDGISAPLSLLLADLAAHSICAGPPWRGGAPEILRNRMARAAALAGASDGRIALVQAAEACLFGDIHGADALWQRARTIMRERRSEGDLHAMPPLPMLSEPDAGWRCGYLERAAAAGAFPRLLVHSFREGYFGSDALRRIVEGAAREAHRAIVIWGAGVKGGLVCGHLRSRGHEVRAFVDSRATGRWAGCLVMSPDRLRTIQPRPLVIIALDPRRHHEVLEYLDALGHPPDLTLCCPEF